MTKVSNNKKVIAVIVTYNRKELLKECIEALLHQDYKNCDILIVDNASRDGTKEYISKELKNNRVFYENTGSNLGGAGGFNFGIKKAYEIGCDFVWVMDDDCIVHNDTLVELLNANNRIKEKYGFLSSKVLWKDNSICKMNIPKRTFSKWLVDYNTNMQKIAMASFVSLFIPITIVEELGLPIKEFFIWTDDWEYTRRISRKYNCYYISSSIVTHKSNSNIGADLSTETGERINRFKYLYRNDRVLYRGEGFKGTILLFLRICKHILKILLSKCDNKINRIKIMFNALKEGNKFYPKIEYVEKRKIKVIEFFGEPLNYGGQEAFIKNIYENIDHEKFEFTFITPFEAKNNNLKLLIKQNNDKIICRNNIFDTYFRKKYINDTAKKYLNSNYDIIHIHSGSLFTLYKVAKLAKKSKIGKVIVHSHATGVNTLKYKIIKFISDRNIDKYVDIYFASSKEAGIWKFPKSVIESDKFIIIKNGIDLDKYKFDINKRKEYRKKFNLENKNIICNVGRYSKEKNQIFALKVLKEYIKLDKNAFMVFCGGNGELEEQISLYVNDNNLKDYVLILKNRDDISSILNMSDIFILPSLWEGLGIAAIESQASGLHTLCSENVPLDAKASELFHSISLDLGEKKWAKEINKLIASKRIDVTKSINANGFDIKESVKVLENFYNL